MAASLVILPGTAHAAAFSVTKTDDTNDGACNTDCSLREAVVAANATPGPNTIAIPAGTYTMTIAGTGENAAATGDLDVTGEVAIAGAGAGSTILDANDVDRAFEIHPQAQATISSMSIVRGFSTQPGGGLRVVGGSLVLRGVAVDDNVADSDAGGGGIWNGDGGRLNVFSSTISDNEGANGGGILNDGASMGMVNSTVSGNITTTGALGGGGILNTNGGSSLIQYSTIADNEADDVGTAAGGDALAGSGAAATIRVMSSILASPEDGLGAACFGFAPGMLSSAGYNLASDASCGLAATGDQVGDPLLDPLLPSGGSTRTMLPSTGSPAIDRVPAGTNGCGTDVVEDQRGVTRGETCDSGAVEVERTRGEEPGPPPPPPGPPGPCMTPPAGMRAWWTLDEAAGPTAFDTAGLANNGTRTGGPGTITGKVANALNFDGVNDYVTAPHHGELLFGKGSLSIDAWVKTTVRNGVQPIVDKRIQNNAGKAAGYTLFLYDGRLSIQLGNGVRHPGAGYFNYIPPASNAKSFVANGKWRHVVATVRRPSSPQIVLYVDGATAATFPTANVLLGNLDDNGPLWIGRRRPVPNSGYENVYFKGGIDEVELFNRPLTSGEVKSLYQAGPSGKCKNPSGLTNLVPAGTADQAVAAGDKKCRRQPYFRYVGGNPDDFAAPVEPTYRSTNLGSFDSGPRSSYDDTTSNRWFGDSFNLEEKRRVCHVVIRMKMKQNNFLANNDNLYIGHVENGNALPTPFTTAIASAYFPAGPGTGPVTRVWTLNAAGLAGLSAITGAANPNDSVLDFYVQDDTTVDHIMLWVWYHP